MHARIISAAIMAGGGLLVAVLALGAGDSASAAPTCADTFGIATHGQHIIGDYVTGVGRDNLDWPPSGGIVGEETKDGGAAIHGGPGPGFHFLQDPPLAPGASLCVSHSKSPGDHF